MNKKTDWLVVADGLDAARAAAGLEGCTCGSPQRPEGRCLHCRLAEADAALRRLMTASFSDVWLAVEVIQRGAERREEVAMRLPEQDELALARLLPKGREPTARELAVAMARVSPEWAGWAALGGWSDMESPWGSRGGRGRWRSSAAWLAREAGGVTRGRTRGRRRI